MRSLPSTSVVNELMVREIVREQLVEEMPFEGQLLLEGLDGAMLKDVVQFAVSAGVEYGLAATVAGAPAAPAAEVLVDAAFAAEEVASTVAAISDLKDSVGHFADAVQNCYNAYDGSNLSAYYDTVVEVVREGLELLGKELGEKIEKIVEEFKEAMMKVIGGVVEAVESGIKLIIPDATIGTAAAEALGALLKKAAENAYSMAVGVIEKVKFLKDFISNPSMVTDFFREGFDMLDDLMRKFAEELGEKSLMDSLKTALTKGPGWAAIEKMGPTVLEKGANAIEKYAPKVLDLVDKIMTMVIPMMFTSLAIFECLMKGDHKKKEGGEEAEEGEESEESADAKKEKPAKKEKEEKVKESLESLLLRKQIRETLLSQRRLR